MLLAMVLAQFAGPFDAAAQMTPVADTTVESLGTAGKLYVSGETVPATMAGPLTEGSAAAAAPAPVTLPPPTKRVHDLPDLRPFDRVRPFRSVAFGVKVSTLGGGAEMAVPVARKWNVRFGASYLKLQYPFSTDGIGYSPGLKFTSGQGTVDWFPSHNGFHVSLGALYFRNSIAGTASVAEGQSFTLNNTTYVNSPDDPVEGTASVAYGKRIAPLVLLGFGNVLPRSGRHFSVPIEFGGAYLESPQINLQLAGTACTSAGCFNAGADPQMQANVKAEATKLQNDLRLLSVYPIVSVGLACRF